MARKIQTIDQKRISLRIVTIISIIIFLISLVTAVTVWKTQVESRIEILEANSENNNIAISKLVSENNDLKVRLASIDTKLTNIDTTLMEIKNRL